MELLFHPSLALLSITQLTSAFTGGGGKTYPVQHALSKSAREGFSAVPASTLSGRTDWCFYSSQRGVSVGDCCECYYRFHSYNLQFPQGFSLPLVPGLHGTPASACSSRGSSLLKSSLGTIPPLLQVPTAQSFLLTPAPLPSTSNDSVSLQVQGFC